MKDKLLVISIVLKASYKSVIFALFKASFSSNNDGHYLFPVDKSLEHFLLRLYFFRARRKVYDFFLIFDYYPIDQLLFESSMGKKSVDSIVRAQVVALAGAGFS